MSTRHALMHQFLQDYFTTNTGTKDYQTHPLTGDASFRHYYRITKGDDTYLLMDAPPDKESVTSFIHVAQLFGQAVNTPDILAQDVNNGFLLLQDFGTVQFADLLTQHDDSALYQKAFDTLAKLQRLPKSSLPLYDHRLLADELALFEDWFLPYVGKKTPPFWSNLCQYLIEHMQSQPQTVVHRDYHSRNLMQDKHSELLGVIDFQDAVIGPYAYDVVSLVQDAYIDQDRNWVTKRLKDAHPKFSDKPFDDFAYDVAICGIQRALKVLGIFVRLSQRDGKDRYLASLPKVLQDTKDQLAFVLTKNDDPTFAAFASWLAILQLPAGN